MRHNTPHPRELKARAEKLFGKGGKTSDGPLMTAGELMVSGTDWLNVGSAGDWLWGVWGVVDCAK